jgi:hypothetical protein
MATSRALTGMPIDELRSGFALVARSERPNGEWMMRRDKRKRRNNTVRQ